MYSLYFALAFDQMKGTDYYRPELVFLVSSPIWLPQGYVPYRWYQVDPLGLDQTRTVSRSTFQFPLFGLNFCLPVNSQDRCIDAIMEEKQKTEEEKVLWRWGENSPHYSPWRLERQRALCEEVSFSRFNFLSLLIFFTLTELFSIVTVARG